jgi:hypothetical protein
VSKQVQKIVSEAREIVGESLLDQATLFTKALKKTVKLLDSPVQRAEFVQNLIEEFDFWSALNYLTCSP